MTFTYMDQQDDFDKLCSTLNGEDQLAVDTEFVRRTTYYPILALLQIASKDGIYLIDPHGITDWSGLLDIFRSDTRIVMHSCSEDLEVFRKTFDQLPENLFDTQIAAAYLGKGDSLGYAALVALMRNQEIDKSETQSDWSQRPLSESQLAYAAEDVRWLLGIASELSEELVQCGRQDWVTEEINALNRKYEFEASPEVSWLRLKGVNRLNESSWPLAQALCDWRETTARRKDKPKSWIAKDAELLEIIQRQPQNQTDLSRLSGISPPLVRHHGSKILEFVASGQHLPAPSQAPAPQLTASERKLLKSMQSVVSDYSESQGLAARFVANKQELSQYILFHHDRSTIRSSLDEGWRKEQLGEQLQALL